MKVLRKALLSVVAVFALCLLSGLGTVHANAADYTVVYFGDQWRYMEGGYDTGKLNYGGTRELYYLNQKIADGDTVTFVGNGSQATVTIDANLKELYVVNSATPLITVKSVENVYVTRDSKCVVNGDVTNAYVYSNGVVTFNSNVTNMIFANDGTTLPVPDVSVVGTVAYFEKRNADGAAVQTLYDFKAGKFSADDGVIKTAASYYSTTGTKPATAAASASTETASSTKTTDPKTFSKKMADYALVFDATYYVEKYADLKAAFGTDEKALFNHFLTCGMKEGRQAIATFDVQYYKSQYADLQKAFGDDMAAYYIHYIQFGKNEGRTAVK